MSAWGGHGKADIVREVAWIYYYRKDQIADKGGEGSKNPKILRTSYVHAPLKENRGVDAVFEAAVRAAKEGRSTGVIGINKIKNGCTLL